MYSWRVFSKRWCDRKSLQIHNNFSSFVHSYLEKFTEFLSLFVSIHLKRFEPNNHFPTAELLSLLVKYTSLQVRIFELNFMCYMSDHSGNLQVP